MKTVTHDHDDRIRDRLRRQAATFTDPGFAVDGVEWVTDVVAAQRSESVLDVAAGAGQLGRALAPQAAHVVCLDLTPEMLARGDRLAYAAGLRNVTFQLGDAMHLPWLDGQFDLVVCRSVLHQVADPAAMMQEMVRVTRAGGRVGVADLVVSSPDTADETNRLQRLRDPSHNRTVSRQEILDLLSGHGVQITECEEARISVDVDDWLERMQAPAAVRAETIGRLTDELTGMAPPTGLEPRRNDDGALGFVQRWITVVGRKPLGTSDRNPLGVSRKLTALTESATLKVDAEAKALRAAGRPVIGFAAGEPEFATPSHVLDAAARAIRDEANHRYTPVAGLPELRVAIAETTRTDATVPITAAHVLVTNGGKHAVYQTFQAVLNPGDEVLLPAPYWTTYPEAIHLADGVPVTVIAGAEQDYKVTVEQLEAARTPRTVALVLVSPSNPTGMVYSTHEIRAIGEWALTHDIRVISDEIYHHLVYDGTAAASVLEVVPELADTAVILDGVAKTYAMTGWRVGWMIGPPDVIKVATNLQSHLSSNVNNIAQYAALAAITGPREPVEEFRRVFDRRRHLMVEGLRGIEGLRVPVPRGAFYAYPDVSGLLGRRWANAQPATSLELADLILDQANVAVVPGEAFGSPGHLRLSFAAADSDIRDGTERLRSLFTE